MSKDILINKESFRINNDEYTKLEHPEYNNLNILDQLGFHERIISLLIELSKLYKHKVDIKMNDVSHGGFIPIKCSKSFNNIYINNNHIHKDNILYNIINHLENKNIFYFNDHNYEYEINNDIIISSKQNDKYYKYLINNTNLYIYTSPKINSIFIDHFGCYIKNNILYYDNLIHFCVMVKNAGPQFNEMLQKNMPFIDRWTILDTGSTDETIQIIKDNLNEKQGKLYEEPFINFKDSRNRCLDLAGNNCKFIIMLDDTYVIDGDLRNFLNIVRGDQFATSFSIFIKSDDTEYCSNRIIRSDSNLRYINKIHEVITDENNINIIIPKKDCKIIDYRFDYMEERTIKRKELDLKLLYEELEENKTNPRTYYYLGQTYSLLKQYDKAFEFFMKRAEFSNSGFIQERIDAIFEAARIYNFQLNKPWEECEALYEKSYKIDESRPESIYFIGINYYLKKEYKKAFEFLKKGFQIGYPVHCQYSLKPTLSYHFLPKFLTRLCYQFEDYILGETVSQFFLMNNEQTAEDYNEIKSYYSIFKKLNEYKGNKKLSTSLYSKPLFVFVADGGFHPWTGSDILTSGVGGSETYIIQMARYIQQQGTFQVIVFCNCNNPEIFENVEYKHLSIFPTFINETYVEHCMISRFAEYIPLAYKGHTENIYLVLHDLGPSINVIPIELKLKNIFCLSEWHVSYFLKSFQLSSITVPFYYGINDFKSTTKNPYQFIYSSFPNRGLLPLLQMWKSIYQMNSHASLHIYSDVDGKWVNEFYKEQMIEIRRLLEINKNLNIYYHGWVDKNTLEKAWSSSDIWFYPCIFMETFCLTALESAISKTLVFSNDLAALQNTVGDRGIVIPGDPLTTEWQNKALEKISLYFSSKDKKIYDNYREQNYIWASSLSWKNQANKLLDQYILPNKFKYKGVYGWYNDIPFNSRDKFISILQKFDTKSVKLLEIGTYTGMSLINMLKQLPNAIGYGIDSDIEQSFYENGAIAGLHNRMFGIKGESHDILTNMVINGDKFDFIYINENHSYTDYYLAWKILNKNGIIAIDNYNYIDNSIPLLNIKNDSSKYHEIDNFLKKYIKEYRIIDISYRVFLEKL
jgi:hypothetical protein